MLADYWELALRQNIPGHQDVASAPKNHNTGLFVFSTSTPLEFYCTSNRLISLFNVARQATHCKTNNNFGVNIVRNNAYETALRWKYHTCDLPSVCCAHWCVLRHHVGTVIFPHLLTANTVLGYVCSWSRQQTRETAVALQRFKPSAQPASDPLLWATWNRGAKQPESLRVYQRRCEVACSLECYWETVL